MNLSDVFIGGAGALVTVLDDQTFNTSGTWTKPPELTLAPDDIALIEMWGGGAGGSVASTGTPSGGSGGKYIRIVRPVSEVLMAPAMIVGAGGLGAHSSNAPGGQRSRTTGGDTIFMGVTTRGGAVASNVEDQVYNGGGGGTGADDFGKSIYGGDGGAGANEPSSTAIASNGHSPGGGGGGARHTTTNPNYGIGGDGAPGRIRIRILRGLSVFELEERF